MFNNLFGGLFDFNGDGETSAIEAGVGFAIMQDILDDNDGDCEACSSEDHEEGDASDAEEVEMLQEELDELNAQLLDLELEEPDMFSCAHDHWESRRDELVDQIQELEDQIAAME